MFQFYQHKLNLTEVPLGKPFTDDEVEAVSGDGTEKAGGGCRPFVSDERECNVSDRSTGHRIPPFDLGFVLDLYDC